MKFLLTLTLLLTSTTLLANENSYSKVAKAHPSSQLSKKMVENAKLKGECLVD